jgi:hypothetical protein
MRARECALWALAIFLSLALLIAPALWNGFALLQYDTGGYLARWYEGILVPSRAVVYGLMLAAGAPLAFWPVLAVQGVATIWVVALMLRAHGLGRKPLILLGIVAALSVISTLPWLTSILLTDIFCGLGVLALYLLLMRHAMLSRREQIGLITRRPAARLGHGLLALAFSAVLVLAADYVVAKRLAWTPGGFALSFGRMLQDGIIKKYLDEHCPDPALKLCAHKDQLPDDADVWFWGSPLFDRLGRFAGLDAEMEKIAVASVLAYPGLQAETAAVATGKQLIDVHSGEGVVTSIWHTYRIIERYTPRLVPAMHAARQQHGGISFTAINRLHYPVALLSMALLPFIALLARLKTGDREIAELAVAVTLALLANAFVCGALSNPHDRYGARMVWLAVFVVVLALARTAAPRLGKPAI